jgi:DNA-binding response OmpR family regulator
MTRVLVIEDEPKLLRAVVDGLREQGHSVEAAATGPEGLRQASRGEFDAVILDLRLPGRDGLRVLRDLRAGGSRVPVLILTSRDTLEERVAGLDAGADDYLVKPFAWVELLARLRALLRRSQEVQSTLRAGDLVMDLVHRRVSRGRTDISLTPREWEVLEYLVRRQGEVVSRAALSRDVWHEPQILTNVVEVCIRTLRRKIELPGTRPLICTVRGAGYTVRPES